MRPFLPDLVACGPSYGLLNLMAQIPLDFSSFNLDSLTPRIMNLKGFNGQGPEKILLCHLDMDL